MTTSVLIALLASFLWGITNHIDKFMINSIDESGSSIKTLLVFSTLAAGIILSPIFLLINNFSIIISVKSLISIFSASFIYIMATYFYFKALEKNDASIVVVMFQLIPVFSYILSLVIFKEELTSQQIIGSVIIMSSAIIISFDLDKKNNNNSNSRFKALLLMTFSSLLYAIYFILFDVAIRDSSYNSCAFWYQIGLILIGIVLISISSFRKAFIKAIKNNGKTYLSLNIVNEILNLIANLLVNFTNLLLPIALVNVLNGFQGVFVFIIGVIGVKLLPKYFKENMNHKNVLQKVGCIVLSIIGLIVMFI